MVRMEWAFWFCLLSTQISLVDLWVPGVNRSKSLTSYSYDCYRLGANLHLPKHLAFHPHFSAPSNPSPFLSPNEQNSFMPAMHYLRKIEELMEKIATQQSKNSPQKTWEKLSCLYFLRRVVSPLPFPNWELGFGPLMPESRMMNNSNPPATWAFSTTCQMVVFYTATVYSALMLLKGYHEHS